MSRIPIVEDDPAIRCGLNDNLGFESHQILTAAERRGRTKRWALWIPLPQADPTARRPQGADARMYPEGDK